MNVCRGSGAVGCEGRENRRFLLRMKKFSARCIKNRIIFLHKIRSISSTCLILILTRSALTDPSIITFSFLFRLTTTGVSSSSGLDLWATEAGGGEAGERQPVSGAGAQAPVAPPRHRAADAHSLNLGLVVSLHQLRREVLEAHGRLWVAAQPGPGGVSSTSRRKRRSLSPPYRSIRAHTVPFPPPAQMAVGRQPPGAMYTGDCGGAQGGRTLRVLLTALRYVAKVFDCAASGRGSRCAQASREFSLLNWSL